MVLSGGHVNFHHFLEQNSVFLVYLHRLDDFLFREEPSLALVRGKPTAKLLIIPACQSS